MGKLSKSTEAPVSQDKPNAFAVEKPGASTKAVGGGQNIVQKRKARIAEAIKVGTPFTFKERREGDFTCFCGSKGKKAIVLLDKNGDEVLCGETCLKQTGVELPPKERKSRGDAPGVSRKQRMQDELGKLKPPFKFKEKRVGAFTCLCGGKGSNQIVISDSNNAEFSVGQTCAGSVPGVEIPKVAPKRKSKVAGLKGGVKPGFEEVG